MATTNLNFNKGSDFPTWQWLPVHTNGTPQYHGFDSAYDGTRYIYYVSQYGVATTAASTSALWRFDTWSHGHQFLTAVTSGNQGMSLAYDKVRNVIIITIGAATTAWQIFNLNSSAVSICGVTCNPFVIKTMTPVLPTAAGLGSTIEIADPDDIPAEIENSLVTIGSTSTVINDTNADSAFMDGMLYLQFRMTSGTYSGQKRIVSAIGGSDTLTLNAALGGAPSAGDSYIIELPQGTATATFNTTTLADSTMAWVVNSYTDHDVLITGGTGAGQKRRIASNTATVLTLAAAVTGNTNTGPWSVAPDATSTYKIQPSSDFLWYQVGPATGFHRIDLATGSTATAWVSRATVTAATGGCANLMWNSSSPFVMYVVRGAATNTIYMYNVGLNSFSTLATLSGTETWNTGGSVALWRGQRKILIHKESTTRVMAMNLANRQLEPMCTLPYAVPGAYDGKRLRQIRTADGVDWLYYFRTTSNEVFRVPLEWGTL